MRTETQMLNIENTLNVSLRKLTVRVDISYISLCFILILTKINRSDNTLLRQGYEEIGLLKPLVYTPWRLTGVH